MRRAHDLLPEAAALAANIYRFRCGQKLTQRQLGEKATVSQRTVARAEQGAVTGDTCLANAVRISNALGVPFRDMLLPPPEGWEKELERELQDVPLWRFSQWPLGSSRRIEVKQI